MLLSDSPCLSLAIAQLSAAEPDHYAVWVLQAPYPAGYVLHDQIFSKSLSDIWHAWRSMFSLQSPPESNPFDPQLLTAAPDGASASYTGLLMQHLGINLWKWVFDGPIQSSFDHSLGIAVGQRHPLRLRLEIRDPNLIALPWEIMQSQPGKQAVSLSQQILFSRTTSAVDPLLPLRSEYVLKVLLVLGHDTEAGSNSAALQSSSEPYLKLEQEATALSQILKSSGEIGTTNSLAPPVPCDVKILLQPTAAELIDNLETQAYNVFFYAGHGVAAPDGGLLFLRSDATINGTELAQVLTRCQVKLAVFNACWGAQPDHLNGQAIPRSSLAEVLIHHGVPSVLGMRDSIADHEARSFIQVFARSLAERSPIDEAVAIARQHLLTLYHFNHPAWSLPVLYMHPGFNGELIKPLTEGVTEIPDNSSSWLGRQTPPAFLRSLATPNQIWTIRGGIMRVGRGEGNDLVLQQPGVSREHAAIFYRDSLSSDTEPTYFLRDFSRFGTLIMGPSGWYKVHQREVPLQSQAQLKFGNFQVEFVVEGT
jgi:hypothetical protein